GIFMNRLLTRSLLIAALCMCLAVPAWAADTGSVYTDDAYVAAGGDRSDGNRMTRDSQIGPEDGGTTGTRGMTRGDGNVRTMNDGGTYRTRAANDGMNWSWLGLLGLIGLAGLMRGD